MTLELLNRVGALQVVGDDSIEQIERNLRNVDFFLSGTILEQSNDIFAVFKLTSRSNGSIVASTEPLAVPPSLVASACGDGAVPIDAATRQIADEFRDRAHQMQHMVVEGGYYANTNGKTEFSQYLEELIVASLTSAFEDPISQRVLSVQYLHSVDSGSLLAMRGLDITATELAEGLVETMIAGVEVDPENVYRLRFRYWPCDGAARLVVRLQGNSGETHSWIGSVRLATVPDDLSLVPPRPTETRDWGPDGAFTFQMTSQRGPNPSFRPGERFETLFRLSRDAWLFCFYTDSDGDTVQVLPNPFQIDRADANFYPGNKLHLFPDKERLPEPDPFDLTVNDKTFGIEVFRCFATSRDIRDDLPTALRGTSLEPIDPRYATRLREIFQALEGASISTASMTVTVIE